MVLGVRVSLGLDTNEPAVGRPGEYFREDDGRDLHLRPVITFMMRRPLEGSLLEREAEAEGTASDSRSVIFLCFLRFLWLFAVFAVICRNWLLDELFSVRLKNFSIPRAGSTTQHK